MLRVVCVGHIGRRPLSLYDRLNPLDKHFVLASKLHTYFGQTSWPRVMLELPLIASSEL